MCSRTFETLHTQMAPFKYHVETFCGLVGQTVTLTLESQKQFKGKRVEGKPVACDKQEACPAKVQARCYLKALAIEARRRV